MANEYALAYTAPREIDRSLLPVIAKFRYAASSNRRNRLRIKASFQPYRLVRRPFVVRGPMASAN